jgi:type I restriction enzyme S subunit
MNTERLLANYESIADAPVAIPRLRLFVLDLAVRGKLVPQDPTDLPASELLKRIAKEKAKLVEAGIRKPRVISAASHELPFALPSHWTTASLDQLSPYSLIDGDWIETKDQSEIGTVRLIQLADVGVGKFLNKSARFVTEATSVRLNCTRLVPGDVLIARLPSPIGRACLFSDIGQPAITAVDVAILRLDQNLDPAFLVLSLNAPPTRRQIEAYGKGTTRFRVSTGDLKTVILPIPPLAEQHRIVSKVDELMALCDRLEAARTECEATRDRFTAASFARLSAPDPDTFRGDVRFVVDALPVLTARADQIKHLRQTIINLAVSGKLVPQDPGDGTGDELLRKLIDLRNQSRIGSRGKREGSKDEIRDEEKYFEIPGSWAWARVHQVGMTQTGTSPSSSNPGLFGDHVPFVKPADLNGNAINYDGPGLTEEGMHHSRVAPANTVLMVCIGATLGKVNITDRTICFNQQINAVTPYADEIHRFIALALKTSGFQELAWSKAGTGTLPIISKGKWEVLPISLPPLAEQQRIVAKVDELMALCDRLEASLATADETRRRLLVTLLAEALASEDMRELKAAE